MRVLPLIAYLALGLAGIGYAAEPPVVPVGLDAYRLWDRWPQQRIGARAYMRSTFSDHPSPERGKDLVLLDTRGIEGSRDWTGSFIGTSWIFSHRAVLNTLEGDPRFFFDDSRSSQCYGTGTEEWGGGGDYWGGLNMTLPLAGHPCGARKPEEAKDPQDLIESAYRFLLADLMPFGRNAVIRLEHGGENQSEEHYETVTYWYGLPGASLVRADELDVGDPASERSHDYSSPDASEPESITSRYEWGIDSYRLDKDRKPLKSSAEKTAQSVEVEVYAPHVENGRHTAGTSEFTLRLQPDNLGVLVRRTLDYSFPNQRAEVYVADASHGLPRGEESWEYAGVWYLAGSNTCVFSRPREELGKTLHIVQTSNRRFRDDEFLIGRKLTEGRKAIRVRVKFTPVRRPLFSGHPMGDLAWSELGYQAYCFAMPPEPVSRQ